MATKTPNMPAFGGGAHTAGIFSDMTVDGPVIGTLVVIMDRARNLPNKRTMGKQDPYCAARLGKEAKKTRTDKRGGQTPRWDQELRFTVHDSPDYHRLKVSVFNDDKKTELIGECWVNLDAVISPGGGQGDEWHGLSCKGKYAGEIRIELTYYDTRPKAEKQALEKRREAARPEGQSPAVGGPRESTPIKRRPLPSDPTGASPSPVNTPEHRGLRGIRAGPRELGSPRHAQLQSQETTPQRPLADTPSRRPLPDASPLAGTPVSNHHTPQRQSTQDPYTPPNPRPSLSNIAQQNGESFDMSYAAPKSYEVQTRQAIPQHVRDSGHGRTMSQDEMRSSRGYSNPPPPVEPTHAHSAPMVPTQHSYESQMMQIEYSQPQEDLRGRSHDQYDDPAYQVAPLRPSRSRDHSPGLSPHEMYHSDGYDSSSSHRRRSAMQPMVEDEDYDMPPPPPVHRRDASTLPHPAQEAQRAYQDEAPAPLNNSRYREESPRASYEPQQSSYEPPNPYASTDYTRQAPSERRYTHPRGPTNETSRPVSRDAMVPSPLRQETTALPSSLIAGRNPSRDLVSFQPPPPSYEPTPRLRQYSEPAEYRAITQYEAPSYSQAMVHRGSMPSYDPPYYEHDPPEQPRRTSPIHDPTPIVKPRATSPGVSPRHSPNPVDDRSARGPTRSMPTRKSVSPRPPPMEDHGERRLSSVAFSPDDFNIYNPTVTRSPAPGTQEDERPGSRMEYNDQGQIVTFSGRVVDASDHLPIDNWAPEPTPKGTVKEKPIRARAQLNGSRDIEAARQREEKYRRDREARDHLRRSTSDLFGDAESQASSNALVTTRHDFNRYDSSTQSSALVLADRDATSMYSDRSDRPQRRSPRPSYDNSMQSYDPPSYSSNARDDRVLRERHNPNSYGSSQSYASRQSAPPIPAKIPLERGSAIQNEDFALSLELQSIDIGPGSGGRRGAARTRGRGYGF